MRSALRSLCLFLAAACLAVDAAAQDATAPAHPDPIEPLRAAMKEQDDLADQGKADAAVSAARERAKDGTPDSLYLLGRALGNAAMRRAEQARQDRMKARKPSRDEPPPPLVFEGDAARMLDEARDCFERAEEAGGLVYAPSHLGIGRVARAKGEVDAAIEELKQAMRIAPNFKDAAMELAQSYSQKQLWAEAEQTLRTFLVERSNDPDARVMLGFLLMSPWRKRYSEAEPEFRAVLARDPANAAARKLLAAVLMYQEKYEESAQHWEMVRRADPKDDEAYLTLFQIYRKLNKREEGMRVLNDVVATAPPGSEAARTAKAYLDDLAEHPEHWSEQDASDPVREQKAIVHRLESSDPAVVQKALEDMRAYRWPALPGAVYQTLLRDKGTPGQRLAAVRLIADLADPRTLTILEIMLSHPKERETDAGVRKEVARAISLLPTDAIVPIFFDVLTDADADVREYAVQGIASRTGKWFRATLATRTEDKDWAAELELYRKWWNSSSASAAKRSAMLQLAAIYEPVAHDSKVRIAAYALCAMDDPIEATWRAGYELFRALTFHTFGSETGGVSEEDRRKIAADARAWLEEQLKKAN
jgi:tetratricopeptide (TPR) repeat protein